MSQSTVLSAETLLQHEPFVRAVVRGLLSDEGRVQDVLQETWLTALRQPPRAKGSLRVWLARVAGNLARDSHRATSRRAAREHAVARPELAESVDVTYERLSAQHEVVEAVLALKEPYKGVVFLRYYQDRSIAEIAERLGRSASTVRSQLSRAHEVLRSALDNRFAGERSAWASLCLPLTPGVPLIGAGGRVSVSTGAKAVGSLLVLGTLAVVVIPRLLETNEPAVQQKLAPHNLEAALSLPRPRSELVAVEAKPGGARKAVDIINQEQQALLGSRSIPELFELAVQTQRAIEKLVLTPDEKVVSQHSAFLALSNTGICRILIGNGTESSLDHAITKSGGGTYYSFATQNHNYNAEPDLSFHHGKFGAGLYGIQVGLLLELGDIPLADLAERRDPVPYSLPAEKRELWEILWADISMEDAAHNSTFRQRTKELQRRIGSTGTATTFLLRVFSPDEHDHLVAFRPLVLDGGGCTLAWRILKTWPVPGEKRGPHHGKDEHPEVPEGPSWLTEMSLGSLIDFLAQVRGHARKELLDVSPDLKDRYSTAVSQPATSFAVQTGFARIVHRGRWDALVEVRGGGAYFSFLTRSNSYDEKPELSLQGDRYSSGFAGSDTGFLLDLGVIPFDQLGAVMSGGAPSELSERQRETRDFMGSVRATVEDSRYGGRRSLSEADAKRASELGLGKPVPALVGHTYLLRSVLFYEHDHLVVFTVIGGDEYGHTLAWRILRSWPVDQ